VGEIAQAPVESLPAWGDVAAIDLDFAVWTREGVAAPITRSELEAFQPGEGTRSGGTA
jgi:hypothetical protein